MNYVPGINPQGELDPSYDAPPESTWPRIPNSDGENPPQPTAATPALPSYSFTGVLAGLPDGSVFISGDDGQWHHIPDPGTFNALGLKWSAITWYGDLPGTSGTPLPPLPPYQQPSATDTTTVLPSIGQLPMQPIRADGRVPLTYGFRINPLPDLTKLAKTLGYVVDEIAGRAEKKLEAALHQAALNVRDPSLDRFQTTTGYIADAASALAIYSAATGDEPGAIVFEGVAVAAGWLSLGAAGANFVRHPADKARMTDLIVAATLQLAPARFPEVKKQTRDAASLAVDLAYDYLGLATANNK